jgi:nucleotide-binding universal stress UspA family protein
MNPIVVGLDPSKSSQAAARWATTVAVETGAGVGGTVHKIINRSTVPVVLVPVARRRTAGAR